MAKSVLTTFDKGVPCPVCSRPVFASQPAVTCLFTPTFIARRGMEEEYDVKPGDLMIEMDWHTQIVMHESCFRTLAESSMPYLAKSPQAAQRINERK